jgi:hypothetical protein
VHLAAESGLGLGEERRQRDGVGERKETGRDRQRQAETAEADEFLTTASTKSKCI